MSLILVAKNESGNKQQANPPQPPNLSKGKAIPRSLTLSQFKA